MCNLIAGIGTEGKRRVKLSSRKDRSPCPRLILPFLAWCKQSPHNRGELLYLLLSSLPPWRLALQQLRHLQLAHLRQLAQRQLHHLTRHSIEDLLHPCPQAPRDCELVIPIPFC